MCDLTDDSSAPCWSLQRRPAGGSVPSDELFEWWSDRVGATGLALYGRRLWETMNAHRATADHAPGATPAHVEYARRWRGMPKVAFSSRSSTVDWNTRLVTGDAVAEITRLTADGGGTPFFTALDNAVNLSLEETRSFPGGVVLTRYATRQ